MGIKISGNEYEKCPGGSGSLASRRMAAGDHPVKPGDDVLSVDANSFAHLLY